MEAIAVLLAVLVVLLLAVGVFVVTRIETPRAGEILVVTGGSSGPEMHTKKVFVLPFVRRVQALPVGVQKTEISLPETMTNQGVPLRVDAVVAFKIDTDPGVVGNAIERFSEHPENMTDFVHTVFAGHLRAIVGAMTAEETTTGRDALARAVREASMNEMTNLGLKIDSVQIRDVEDAAGSQFLSAWRQKEQARMLAEARIAEAEADRQATEKEMAAAALKAEAQAQSEIRQAQVKAEADTARARSEQAGPLAQAVSRQQVIEADTRATELEAALKERKLQVDIIKPAEAERDASIARAEGEARSLVLRAEADKQRTTLEAEAGKVRVELAAQADAERVKLAGSAEALRVEQVGAATAKATEATGLAEAKAIEARGQAFEKNAGAVIQQMVAEQLPEIVRAASEPLGHVDNLQVMDIRALQGIPGGNIATAIGLLPQVVEAIDRFATPVANAARRGANGDVPTVAPVTADGVVGRDEATPAS